MTEKPKTGKPKAAKPKTQTLGFETEAKQLLRLMIHSLYSNKEIFLRELISNASDAADRLRFAALSNSKLMKDGSELEVRVDFDEKKRRVTVSDNGIGMTRKEVIDNLGTIAKSGTAQFLESLTGDQQKDSQLIGQFGVGFYSSFIVAEEVEVLTRKAGSGPKTATLWESRGESEYSVEPAEKPERGTAVTLHLKKDAKEFAEGFRLRNIVKRYADHISIPVLMEKRDFGDGGKADAEKKKEKEYEAVNDAKALWTRPRREIKDDEYREFYRHITHDFADPLLWSHNRVEGRLQYTSLLYIPGKAPFDLWNRDAARGLKLYVQRVFIMDDAEQFLPLYLRFMKGVVDSNDISLNVSREILQKDPTVDSMRTALTRRALDMLERLRKKDAEKYAGFWEEFGQVLKEGLAEDAGNKEKVARLLMYLTTASEGDKQDQSLADYAGRMKDGQEKIYYLAADSLKAARNSPLLEIFREKGIEVVLMHDRIDEWVVGHLAEFDGKPLQDISRGELDLGKLGEEKKSGKEKGKGKEKKEEKDKTDALDGLVERIRKHLGERVEDVRVSRRLTSSPACLAIGEHEMGAQMRRIMEASGQKMPDSKPFFEINPGHPLIGKLDAEPDEDRFADLTEILFGQASLAAGGQLDDPGEFSSRLNKLLLELSG